MKLQSTKKLFAFIITIMMFFASTESACGQPGKDKKNPNGYFCNCSVKGYGCGTAGAKCIQYCAGFCYLNTPVNEISLKSIYNPDLQSATISFSLSQSTKLSLKIFDLNGVLLITISDDILEEGEHSIEWSTAEVSEGVYFVQLQSASSYQMEKLIITK